MEPPDRIVGWAITGERGPLPARSRLLRAPYEGLSARIDWLDVPAAGIAERLRTAGDSGAAPDFIAAASSDDLRDLGDVDTHGLSRLLTPIPRNLNIGTRLSFVHDRGPHAGSLRSEMLREPPAGALLVTGRAPDPVLAARAREAATALLGGNDAVLAELRDADSLPTRRDPVAGFRAVHASAPVAHGNDALAFVPVTVVLETDRALGTRVVITAFRRDDQGSWRLLVAAGDPATVGPFLHGVPSGLSRLSLSDAAPQPPSRPALLAPEDGHLPEPAAGERFGNFVFTRAPEAAMHVIEFACEDEVRMFVLDDTPSTAALEVSAGRLWHVEGTWRWRAWAVSSAGRVSFSETRTFEH